MKITDFTFELMSTSGEAVSGEALVGHKFILYFYPKDNTSGCTLEAMDFADLYDEFRSFGYEVIGISKDTLASHHKFREKLSLPFHLLADPNKTLHEQMDVIKEKKMYGKTVLGTERSTFLFDEKGHLLEAFRGVKSKGHAQSVLEYLQSKL